MRRARRHCRRSYPPCPVRGVHRYRRETWQTRVVERREIGPHASLWWRRGSQLCGARPPVGRSRYSATHWRFRSPDPMAPIQYPFGAPRPDRRAPKRCHRDQAGASTSDGKLCRKDSRDNLCEGAGAKATARNDYRLRASLSTRAKRLRGTIKCLSKGQDRRPEVWAPSDLGYGTMAYGFRERDDAASAPPKLNRALKPKSPLRDR